MPELLLTRNTKEFVYHDSDNPFRPEGELAKEAEEFVHEYQEKKEQEVAEIIKQQTSSSSLKPTEPEAKAEGSDVKEVLVEVVPGSPAKANGDAVAPVAAEETPAESKDDKKKKNKTKSKCGCTIS